MHYSPTIHNRHSIRLKGYDYSQAGLYFVTVCVQNRECLFGKIVDGEMVLNEYGKIVETVWHELPQHYSNVYLDAFIVMPNHIHGIIALIDDVADAVVRAGFKPAPTAKQHGLPEIVRALKTFSARKINELRGIAVGAGLKPAPTKPALTKPALTKPAPTKPAPTSVWQRNYYEHIIRNGESYGKISEYIMNNPSKWTEDMHYPG